MTSYLNQIPEKVRQLTEKVPVIDGAITFVSDKIKVQKENTAMVAIMIPFILMIMMGGAHFLIDMVAYVYPAYASIRAIETEGSDDDTMWLKYWLTFSIFKVFEGVADSLLVYIPAYTLTKAAFLFWCFHPGFKGAEKVYEVLLLPYVVPLLNVHAHIAHAPSEKEKDTQDSKKDN